MKRTLFSVIGVLAFAFAAVAQDSKAELSAAVADLVVLDETGKLVSFEPTVSPDYYVVYHSASW